MKLYRTILFAPGNRERMLEKVGKVGADAVVLDLEDAVPADEKTATRAALSGAVERIAKEDGAEVFVRVNPLDDATGFSVACGAEDIAAVVGRGLRGVVLPKAENSGQIRAADRLIREAERGAEREAGSVHLLAILENAKGVANAPAIASADAGERRFWLAFGAGDYTNDLDVAWPRDEFPFDYPRSRIAVASRAAGLEKPLDTVWIALDDQEGLAASARRCRALGMFGKFCIHPRQVDIVNRAFTPMREEVERAREVIAAFEAATARGEASVSVGGSMIDYPVVESAQKVIALENDFGTKDGSEVRG